MELEDIQRLKDMATDKTLDEKLRATRARMTPTIPITIIISEFEKDFINRHFRDPTKIPIGFTAAHKKYLEEMDELPEVDKLSRFVKAIFGSWIDHEVINSLKLYKTDTPASVDMDNTEENAQAEIV